MTTKFRVPQILTEMGADVEFAYRVSTGLKTGQLDLYGDQNGNEASKEWELITDICEGVRENKWRSRSTEQRIDAMLSIIDAFPHYTSSSHLFQIFSHDGDLTDEAKEKLWDGIIRYLSDKNTNVREPIEYVLWVDFFEDQSTCQEAWTELTARACEPVVLDRLLIIGGPVPYALKRPIYESYSKVPSKHAVLAQSLAHSINDVFGKIDKADARRYLDILKLPNQDEYYNYLLERM